MSGDLVSRFINDHPNVEQVELVVTDPSGIARGKWAPVATLKKAFSDGVNFPLSLHGLDVWGNEVPETGLHISSGDKDGFFKAVPSSLSAVPWGGESPAKSPKEASRAQVLLHTFTPDGDVFKGCARNVLAAALERLKARGLTVVCAFELEFHLLEHPSKWRDGQIEIARDEFSGSLENNAQFMYGLDALAKNSPLFADICRAADWADIPLDTIVKEAAPGQFEINLNHRDDALRTADDVILLKRIIRESARAHGVVASFMAKPFADQPGNGMHVHISVLNADGENIFADDEAVLRHAVSGLLASMESATLLFINSKNGFRRMAPGSYAPTRANWGENNRSVAVRLPAATGMARRLEHRVSGADANPYLVLAALVQGILDGLADSKEPPLQLVGNAYEEETPNRGPSLASSMDAALRQFRENEFPARALGDDMAHIIACLKDVEISTFRDEMTPLERSTYV